MIGPIIRYAYRLARDKRELLRLTRKQEGHIRVLEADKADAWSLVTDLQNDVLDLRREREALLEHAPTDISELEAG